MHRKWWTLIAVSVATFMLLLDITVVNTALPAIEEDLGASFTELQWVVDAYTLSLAALVLTAGVLADRLGRRRVFAAGLRWADPFARSEPAEEPRVHLRVPGQLPELHRQVMDQGVHDDVVGRHDSPPPSRNARYPPLGDDRHARSTATARR
jgi:hypothetical protein